MNQKKSPSNSNVLNKTTDGVPRRAADPKRSKSIVSLPLRKTRTKLKKPKYLSLRFQLSHKASQHCKKTKPKSDRTVVNNAVVDDQQLNLFPLHPQNDHHEDHDRDEHDEVAFLFSNSGGSATLNGLLGSDSTAGTTTGTPTTAMSSEEDSFSPPASVLSYARFDCVDNARSLVRTAMKRKERDDDRRERWVCYSAVVEKQEQTTEETTSANSVASATVKKEKEEQYNSYYYWCNNYSSFHNNGRADDRGKTTTLGALSLKLDYQEILNAWSDKGPWYLDGESPQTVPELHDEIFSHSPASNFALDGWGSCGAGNSNGWIVPESGGAGAVDGNESMAGNEGVEGQKSWKTDQKRAESVLRYKEKRQSRLFAKRIRYEVRKLNAEKRPRVKGRFVKR